MKKLIFVLVAGILSQGAFAASSGTGDANAAGAVMVVSSGTGNCEYVKETVNIRLSANIQGAYDCATDAAGVAAGSVKGKGRIYDVSTNGGALVESDVTNAAGVTATAVSGKASNAKSRTSSQ